MNGSMRTQRSWACAAGRLGFATNTPWASDESDRATLNYDATWRVSMGALTLFNGEISITPPIAWSHVRDSRFRPENAAAWCDGRDLKFRLDEQAEEREDGTMIHRQAVALQPTEEVMVRLDIVKHMQEVLDAFPDHEFSGCIEAVGKCGPWQLRVRDRQAVRIEGSIVWPDDENA